MRYISTRGGIAPVPFGEAVMMGLATDGGLLLPESIPVIPEDELRQWAELPFVELAFRVIRPFVGRDIPEPELREMLVRSYATFTHPDVVPVVWVGGQPILELFHGPTLAFKDVALQLLGNLFEYLLNRSGGRLNILGATSGDTGSAAIHGVRGRRGIRIFMLHPHGRVSPIQERQMTSVLDDNVHNVAIRGTFDDGQRIVKTLFNDLEFRQAYALGAVNSINWARILAQVVYYFYGWYRVHGRDLSRRAVFAVPTGNFGDIFAGYMAWRMGLPVDKLVLATNRNDILARFVQTGAYESGVVVPTISPSMDIQVSSNFERFLFYVTGEDPAAVRRCMDAFQDHGRFEVAAAQQAATREIFAARAVTEQETTEQIAALYRQHGYILDPHTAVGVCAAGAWPQAICLATAHPAKFPDAVRQAIGREPELPECLRGVLDRETRCTLLDPDAGQVKRYMTEVLRHAAMPA